MADAAAAAAARRARILARGADRLSKITMGGPATDVQPSSIPDISVEPAPSALTEESKPQAASTPIQAPEPVQITDTVRAEDSSQPQQDAAPQLIRRAAVATAAPSEIQEEIAASPQVSTGMEVSLASESKSSAQLLVAAVRATRLFRILVAMALAHALFSGTLSASQIALPPLVVLALTQFALIGGARLMLASPTLRAVMPLDAWCADPAGGLLPARYRPKTALSLLTQLVPGLDQAMAGAAAGAELASSLWDGVAAFVVAYVLLQAVARAGAAGAGAAAAGQ